MDFFDFISLYYQNLIAIFFRKKQCIENTKKALQYPDYVKFQMTEDRNKVWMEMSLRDREILVEHIILCTLGIKHPRLEYVFYNLMHEEAEKKKLQSIFDIK